MASANSGDLLALVAIGTTVNAVSAARKNTAEDSFGIVFGGIAMFGALATLGQMYDWRLARSFAWLFVFGSIIFRGEGVINWFSIALGQGSRAVDPAPKIKEK